MFTRSSASKGMATSQIGLIGLAVMGQVSAVLCTLCFLLRCKAFYLSLARPTNPVYISHCFVIANTTYWLLKPRQCCRAISCSICRVSSDTRTTRRLQNLALNVADKGFTISVYNRSYDKTEAAVARAAKEGLGTKLHGYKELKDFVMSLERPRYGFFAFFSQLFVVPHGLVTFVLR